MSDLITITGNVATDLERRRTPAGVPVATFRLASSQRHFDRAKQEWVETGTNWYSVSAFRALAEHIVDSLNKGERVIVTGRLRLREWETSAKRGLSVEIDAEAIGHDLRWGTARYQRTSRPESSADRSSSDPGRASTSAQGDDWATPRSADWGAPGAPDAGPSTGEGAMLAVADAHDDVPF